MAVDQDMPKRRVPLWVKLLLGVSLALNLAVVGVAVGFAVRSKDGPGGPGAVFSGLPYVITLPREDKKAIRDRMRAKARSGELPSFRDRRGGYREMVRLLQTEPWDADRARAVLVRQSDQSNAVQTAAQAAWLEQVAQFSVEERKAYAARLQEFVERGRGKKKR